MDSFSPKGHFKTLKMNLIGRDIPVVECKSTVTGKLKLRLDSGAEAPLILQPGFIKKNHLMAGIYEQDPKHPTMPLLDIGKLECHGRNHVKANALLYSGHTGALAHEFVDGNLGALHGQRRLGSEALGPDQRSGRHLRRGTHLGGDPHPMRLVGREWFTK